MQMPAGEEISITNSQNVTTTILTNQAGQCFLQMRLYSNQQKPGPGNNTRYKKIASSKIQMQHAVLSGV